MKKIIFLSSFAVATALASVAPAQITIDGNITEAGYTTLAVQNVASTFGSRLYSLRVASDATNLYIGIPSAHETTWTSDPRGFWVVIGVNSVTAGTDTIDFAGGNATGLNGTVLESGFGPDFIVFAQSGNSAEKQTYYYNFWRLELGTDNYIGAFNSLTNAFAPDGGRPAGFEAAIINYAGTETGATGSAAITQGVELQIPRAQIGNPPDGTQVNFLVGTGNGGNAYFANHTLPTSNSTTNLGGGQGNSPKVNFATNTYGAFGGTSEGFAGSQIASFNLTSAASVSDWSMY